MACDASFFDAMKLAIDGAWPSIWPVAAAKLPRRAGLPFGPANCQTICGSVGITDVQAADLQALLPDTSAATVTFGTCGAQDIARLVVPLDAVPVNVDIEARATGFGTLWPSGGPGAHLVVGTASVSGILLVWAPVHSGRIIWSETEADVRLYAKWAFSWPDTSNRLYATVPTDELASQWASELTQAARKTVIDPLLKSIRVPNAPLTCDFPPTVDQACTASTEMPTTECDPCDTCCRCLVQQRCDGPCASCACVTCAPSTWTPLTVLAGVSILALALAWAMLRRRVRASRSGVSDVV